MQKLKYYYSLFLKLSNKYKFLILFLILFGTIIRLRYLTNLGFYFDTVTTQYEWAKNSYDMGFVDFWKDYPGFLDYLPGSIYLLTLFETIARMFTGASTVLGFVVVLKVFIWIVEVILSIVTFKIAIHQGTLSKRHALLFSSLVYSLPSLWIVSGIWGQIDSFVVLLTIISFLFLFKFFAQRSYQFNFKYAIFSGVFLGIAASIKLQIVLILPALFLLHLSLKNKKIIKYQILGIMLSIFLLNVIPAFTNIHRLGSSIKQPFIRENTISNGASNFLYNIAYTKNSKDAFVQINNFFLDYDNLGKIIFILISLVIVYFFYKNYLRRKKILTFSMTMLFCTIFSFAYFLFMSKMHSRYLHFGIIYGFIYFISIPKRMFVFKNIFISAIILMNFSYFFDQLIVYATHNDNVKWIDQINSWMHFNRSALVSISYMISFTLILIWLYLYQLILDHKIKNSND